MSLPFSPSITPPEETAAALWFIFRGNELLVIEEGETAALPTSPDSLRPDSAALFGKD